MKVYSALLAVCAMLLAGPARTAVEAMDDLGERIRLDKPAARIISFAPHVTEILFAVGAGDRIVGVVRHSDHPEAAKRIPVVGDSSAADLERIVSLSPDLIITWLHPGSMKQLDRLRATGTPVFYSRPMTLAGIESSGERLGMLAGTAPEAARWAEDFRRRRLRLASLYSTRPRVAVFYQFWGRPLHTLNREHFVSDLLATCGAHNVFADLPVVAPVVTMEAVLQADPQAIIGALPEADLAAQWGPWTSLRAVQRGNVISVDPDVVHRPGPRAIAAAELLCERLDEARRRLR